MSFLSVLESIGRAIGVVTTDIQPFEGIISAIPKVGPIAVVVINAIIEAEAKGGTGTAKKATATAIVNKAAPGVVDPATLSNVIDGSVDSLNNLQSVLAQLPATPAKPPATPTTTSTATVSKP